MLPSAAQRSEARVEAERRQVTVLFADMVGFTSFSERSGEEAAFALMRTLWKLMAEAVREHGGVVQDFTGDGIMAVFGVPIAFEDGPLRASRKILKHNTACDLKCELASTPARRWLGRWMIVLTAEVRFSATR